MEHVHKACTLYTVCIQTVYGENEHNKKMKMATARKPELFVLTVNEVKLLLRLTLKYNLSEVQERLNIFCSTAFTGSMWTVGQNDAKRAFTQKSVSMRTAPHSREVHLSPSCRLLGLGEPRCEWLLRYL